MHSVGDFVSWPLLKPSLRRSRLADRFRLIVSWCAECVAEVQKAAFSMARSQMNILATTWWLRRRIYWVPSSKVLELDGWKLSSLELSEFNSPTPQVATKSLKSIKPSIQKVQPEVL